MMVTKNIYNFREKWSSPPPIPGSRLFSPLYQGGGGSPEKKIFFAQITAIAFSYIRTEFGASRSMRVGVRSDKQ